jgi:hypothetical protein
MESKIEKAETDDSVVEIVGPKVEIRPFSVKQSPSKQILS